MKHKILIERWNTLKVKKIIDFLKKSKDLSLLKEIDKIEDKWDLRGISLNLLISEKSFFSTFFNSNDTFKNCVFENIDLSYSKLDDLEFFNVTFKNCIINHVSCKAATFYNCSFIDCKIANSNFSYSKMNIKIGLNSGMFLRTDFTECNLKETSFNFPLIENCSFKDCKLYATNFDGSRFKDCIFEGIVEGCWFGGFSQYAISKTDRNKVGKNEMLNVNFEKAILKGVIFWNAIDLTKTKFPKDSENYFWIHDLEKTYSRFTDYIKKNWNENDIQKATQLIGLLYYNDLKKEQLHDFLDIFPKNKTLTPFEEKFYLTLKEIALQNK